MNRWMRRGAAIAAAALLVVLATSLVLGKGVSLLDGKLRTGDTVTLPLSETWQGDLYLLGGRVTVEGNVDGDLTAFAGQVDVHGNVTGDVLAAGGTITITGNVDGDVRIAGGQLSLAGALKEDVVATGGQVTIQGDATVGGDAIVSGGQVTVSGSVKGSIEGSAGDYSRTGTVGGTDHVVIVQRTGNAPVAGDRVLDAIRHFVVVVLLGALLLWWMPRRMAAADGALRGRPWQALATGLLACVGYIAFVVGAFLAMILLAILFGLLQVGALVAIEIIGGMLALGVVTFLFVLAVTFVADAIVGLALADTAMRMDASNRWSQLGLLAVGAAAVVLVTSIPILGGWAKLAVVLFGLGALTLAWWEAWRSGRGVVAPVPTIEPPPPAAPTI